MIKKSTKRSRVDYRSLTRKRGRVVAAFKDCTPNPTIPCISELKINKTAASRAKGAFSFSIGELKTVGEPI